MKDFWIGFFAGLIFLSFLVSVTDRIVCVSGTYPFLMVEYMHKNYRMIEWEGGK